MKKDILEYVLIFVRKRTSLKVTVVINAADNYEKDIVYLTVTGTSAECGDDGQVGRGNRANGLITPYRPMTLEPLPEKILSLIRVNYIISLPTEYQQN